MINGCLRDKQRLVWIGRLVEQRARDVSRVVSGLILLPKHTDTMSE